MVSQMKRQRGRGGQQRKPGQHPNRSFDSNGPDIKVRGPAPHIYERYLQLARDANSAGDRVQAENFLQHAEHYFRVMRAMQPAAPPPQQYDRFGDDMDEGDEEGDGEGYEADQFRPHQSAQNYQQQPPRQNNGEYQQRDQRENRGEYQQRDNRGEYQQRDNRQYDNRQQDGRQQDRPQDRQERNYAPRDQQGPRDEGQQREQQPREQQAREGGEANAAQQGGFDDRDGPRRNRRGRRNRFRTDGGPERENGAEGESDSPAEGFGDATPAFLVEDDR